MAAGDSTTGDGPVRFKVEGLSKTLRALERAGAAAADMRDGMHRIGNIVVARAVPRAPRKSGRMAGTIRAGRGKTKAVVRMGGGSVPYAGVVHYGWPDRNIAPQPVLIDALQSSRDQIFTALNDELDKLLRDADLK